MFVQAEYNDVNENSYVNTLGTITNQSYSNYNQNLAYTNGSGKELIFIGDYKWKRFFMNVKYNNHNFIQQGETVFYNQLINAKIGYLINPSYNFNIHVGINHRSQSFKNLSGLNNETNFIYLGIRTSIYNLYYDF